PVTVNFLTSQFQASLGLLVILSLVIGMLLGLTAATPRLIRDALAMRTMKKKLAELEASHRESRLQIESTRKPAPAERHETIDKHQGGNAGK
ncbi:MAG TPA: LapA family protein, partial [Roseiflexaceae bacterium]|nr:LapA family protein [Roseiflexaceae bacterium]